MIKFGEIAGKPKRTLEDETDYTPRHVETDNYKLGLIYKTLENSWGTNTSDKVVKKLKKAKRWDLPLEIMKNVHCNFFTQLDPNKPDKIMYMCKVTFSFIAVVHDEAEEQKVIKQYVKWPDSISKMMKQDAQDVVGNKAEVTFSDVTKKYSGNDQFIGKHVSNLCAPATSTVSSYHIPKPFAEKNIYTMTKIYKITLK